MSKPALTTQNVTKIYGEHRALNEVSITVEPQRIFGLLGPNGAGKTTLIRIINQITGPDTGSVSVFGESLRPEHVHDIGSLPEERGLYKKMKVSCSMELSYHTITESHTGQPSIKPPHILVSSRNESCIMYFQ